MARQEFDIAKGVKDWYGKDAMIRNHIRQVLRTVFERYGYNPIETPMIERQETLAYKGGGEIQKEVFRLKDQGNRELALRFDQTVPLARFISSHSEIKMPFKRYAIGEVFRDGPTQPEKGRYRIFTQCDVDIVGIKDMAAEAELLALAQDAFEALGLGGVDVKINNRKLLDGILDYAGVPKTARVNALIALDKADKIGIEGVQQELLGLTDVDSGAMLSEDTLHQVISTYRSGGSLEGMSDQVAKDVGTAGFDEILAYAATMKEPEFVETLVNYKRQGELVLTPAAVETLISVVNPEEDNQKTFAKLDRIISSDRGREGLAEIKTLLDYAERMGLDFVKLDPCLARGLDYYTGTTIEVFLQDKERLNSAILAGGRYDNMVGDFCGGNEFPAVGFSFGLERVAMVLNESTNIGSTPAQVYMVPLGETINDCLRICHDLRRKGINVDMEMNKRKLGTCISYAEQAGIPFVGIVGSNEVSAGKVTLKDLANRIQQLSTLDDMVRVIKTH